jgi:hypothetical protein
MSTGTDISKLLAGFAQAKERARAAALKAINEFGEHVIGDAQQMVPVDTGALAASGTTLPAVEKGNTVEKVIGFNTDYAAAVHERLDVHHEQGQAKYLETAVRENASKLSQYVADRVKASLNGGGGGAGGGGH